MEKKKFYKCDIEHCDNDSEYEGETGSEVCGECKDKLEIEKVEKPNLESEDFKFVGKQEITLE